MPLENNYVFHNYVVGASNEVAFNAARMIYPPYGKAIQKLVYKLFVR